MCLGYDYFGQSSLPLDDRWDAQHGVTRAVMCIKEVINDLKIFVVPDISEDLGACRVFWVPTFDVLQDGPVALDTGAKIGELPQRFADRGVGIVVLRCLLRLLGPFLMGGEFCRFVLSGLSCLDHGSLRRE
jgi:hypothetical protein